MLDNEKISLQNVQMSFHIHVKMSMKSVQNVEMSRVKLRSPTKNQKSLNMMVWKNLLQLKNGATVQLDNV